MTFVFEPEKVIIVDRTVPEGLKGCLEYTRRRKDIESRLRLPKALELFCTHEAGHIIYFKRAGLPTPQFFGPTITYDGKNFDHCTVGVKPPDLENSPDFYTGRFMVRLARAAVAGGVFLEVLLDYSQQENGDADDWDLFEEYSKKVQREDTTRTYDPGRRWKRARARVKKDLETGVITEDEIQNAKAEFRQECFQSR